MIEINEDTSVSFLSFLLDEYIAHADVAMQNSCNLVQIAMRWTGI
jgi:hypothetical protein